MKKLLALVLALMLVMASAAFAETANVATFDNIALLISDANGNYTIDLSDLSATLAAGMPGETPTIQLDVANAGESLLGAVIQFVDGRMLVGIDGVSRPVAAAMNAEGAVNAADAQEGLNTLFANLDAISDLKLPAFTGVTIPKFDLMAVAALLGAQAETDANGAQSASFSLPYEMVQQLLSMVDSLVPAEAQAQAAPVLDLIHQMQASNSGFALEGRVADDGATAELLVDVYLVDGGVTADTAVGGLYIASAENNASLDVLIYQDGQSITLGTIALTSDPAAATLDFSIDAMGELSLTVSLYPQDGAQVAAMALNVEGEVINASLTYGDKDENEFVEFALEIPGEDVSASVYVEEAPDGNGGKAGAMNVNVAAQGETINLTADVAETKADVDFRAIENIDNAYDVNGMSDADSAELDAELQNVLAGLMDYLENLSVQPAA